MNFTREPIIETIITPRDGYRLLVRSTKHESSEEFNVEAVEVVSFGSALFYRSLEKPKPFLLPVADYQVVEGKEARVVLKNAQVERTIKIGGGREAPPRKEEAEEMPPEEELSSEPNLSQKRERRRNRRRHREEKRQQVTQEPSKEPIAPPVFTHLIPPPPNLISDSIQKYKEQQAQEAAKELPPVEGEGEANIISRSVLEPPPFIPPNPSDWNS